MIGIIITKKHNKRRPNKHTDLMCRKPMVCYTLETAINSKLEIVYVVTDDNEVIDIAKKYNNSKIKILKLTPELSEIGSVNTILYALEKYNDNAKIMLLQATSPLRIEDDINICYEIMKNIEIDFISSVFRIRDITIENGAIFCAVLGKLRQKKNWYSNKTLFYLMPEERSIDIDYDYHFKMAETLLKERENGK